VWEALQDITLIILIASAIISLCLAFVPTSHESSDERKSINSLSFMISRKSAANKRQMCRLCRRRLVKTSPGGDTIAGMFCAGLPG
jgi:hypothetical protein